MDDDNGVSGLKLQEKWYQNLEINKKFYYRPKGKS